MVQSNQDNLKSKINDVKYNKTFLNNSGTFYGKGIKVGLIKITSEKMPLYSNNKGVFLGVGKIIYKEIHWWSAFDGDGNELVKDNYDLKLNLPY